MIYDLFILDKEQFYEIIRKLTYSLCFYYPMFSVCQNEVLEILSSLTKYIDKILTSIIPNKYNMKIYFMIIQKIYYK